MARISRKGKPQGRKEPFTREDIHLIRTTLIAHKRWRDLALMEVALDTMLRTRDLLRLRVCDVRKPDGATLHETFPVKQQKTGKTITVRLTPRATKALVDLIYYTGKLPSDFLFTPLPAPHASRPISGTIYRQLIKSFAVIAGKDPRRYSGHSSRRSKASIIYKETKNVEVVRQLLGHSSLAATSAYLGVTQDEVFEVAAKFDNI